MRKRIIAAMPLISLTLFLGAGLFLDKWALGWTFFLLIPMSWILLTGNALRRLSEAMPFIVLTVFLWIGFGFGAWHPGWLVFLFIPITNILVKGGLRPRKVVAWTITAIYIAIGLLTDEWHPSWIIFLLIPIINTIFFPQKNAYVSFSFNGKRNSFRNIIIESEHSDDANDKRF
ncbi:MAG: hypothetical protein ACLFTZ_04845 [Acholeplasmataceae bacterium]